MAPAAAPFGNTIHKLHARVQQLAGENTALKDANDGLKAIWSASRTLAFYEDVAAARRKRNNHTVDRCNRLRVEAGLESTAPAAAVAGWGKVCVNAMIERVCQVNGLPYMEEMHRFAAEQDAIVLEKAEKVMVGVCENMIEKFYELLVEKVEVFGGLCRPLHPVIRAEEVRVVGAAKQDALKTDEEVTEETSEESTEKSERRVDTGVVVGDFADEHSLVGLGITGIPMPKLANMKDVLAEVRAKNQLRISGASDPEKFSEEDTDYRRFHFANTEDLIAEIRAENQLRNCNSFSAIDIIDQNSITHENFSLDDITDESTEQVVRENPELIKDDIAEKVPEDLCEKKSIEEDLKNEEHPDERITGDGHEDEFIRNELKEKLLKYSIEKLGKGGWHMEDLKQGENDEKEKQEDVSLLEKIIGLGFVVGLGICTGEGFSVWIE
ncbi:hypothetical protein GTA08_BOTSDO08985 [Neofusicoccum parvum]|uniref:Uncharacterized protein n=1 Tax=Neofusicoccum parvum TaxID=310453 RepID=A0ACB5SKT2_9PEZI|nr:hypothetical protein GTA08_BOTSDO08985 [Neofusicoccum parvum]